MPRIFLADAQLDERAALRLLLLDLNMKVVGEAADWQATLAQAPATRPNMLLVDWDLLPNGTGVALAELRVACQAVIVVVLISHLEAGQQAALSAGADAFISKGETPDRVAERLRAAARSISILKPSPDRAWSQNRQCGLKNGALRCPERRRKLGQLICVSQILKKESTKC